MARIGVEGAPREQLLADTGRVLVRNARGAAGQRPVLAEDRRFAHERDAQRDHRRVLRQRLAGQRLLVRVRVRLQALVVERLVDVHEPGRQFDAMVPIERIDADGGAAADRLGRLRLIVADERRIGRVVEEPAELAVVEDRLRKALQGELEALADADVGERKGAVLRD